jgi:transketolase
MVIYLLNLLLKQMHLLLKQMQKLKPLQHVKQAKTLQAFGPLLPELLGGSADLAGSNLTLWKGCQGVQDNPAGNYVLWCT